MCTAMFRDLSGTHDSPLRLELTWQPGMHANIGRRYSHANIGRRYSHARTHSHVWVRSAGMRMARAVEQDAVALVRSPSTLLHISLNDDD